MKIGIIGYGVVGKAAENTLKKAYTIRKFDKFQDLDSFEALLECEFIFIVVPTPFDCKNDRVDESAVVENLIKLDRLEYGGTVIVKSTLPPGSCDNYDEKYNLEIVFNPEFLRESTTPNEDFENQETIVIGTHSKKTFQSIKDMYEKVIPKNAEYFHTSAKEAEMIKCAQNTMLASRVALANMIYDACEKNGIDYNNLRKVAFDRFEIIGPHMSRVPGPDGMRGFGGKCLPKDIRAFSTVYNSDLLKEIIGYNDTLRDDLGSFLDNFGEKDDK